MLKVYLLKMIDNDTTIYKIGYTKNSVEDRRKILQTGCPNEIQIVESFESEFSIKIETTLHNIYKHKRIHGEWFSLDLEDEINFKANCEKYHNIQKLINTPFSV